MKTLLITGGAGFIGTNAVDYFASKNWKVIVLDNLSRQGSEDNLSWLESQNGYSIEFLQLDICDSQAIEKVLSDNNIDALIHLAGQVAVTESILNPKKDFEVNAVGTFNILEAMRKFSPETIMINASTNKVYGQLDHLKITQEQDRYQFESMFAGVSEEMPLDFHSPYGCSKGAADIYVIDYARIYELKATTFRQSCIYGPRQFGSEDQGWISWFIHAALFEKTITIYGNGKQVRDILYIDDLIYAYDLAINKPNQIKGEAFNIGGGVRHSISLMELIKMLTKIMKKDILYQFAAVRPGDQKVYISNAEKIKNLLGWEPEVSVETGIKNTLEWTQENIQQI